MAKGGERKSLHSVAVVMRGDASPFLCTSASMREREREVMVIVVSLLISVPVITWCTCILSICQVLDISVVEAKVRVSLMAVRCTHLSMQVFPICFASLFLSAPLLALLAM